MRRTIFPGCCRAVVYDMTHGTNKSQLDEVKNAIHGNPSSFLTPAYVGANEIPVNGDKSVHTLAFIILAEFQQAAYAEGLKKLGFQLLGKKTGYNNKSSRLYIYVYDLGKKKPLGKKLIKKVF